MVGLGFGGHHYLYLVAIPVIDNNYRISGGNGE
jgi:hypothetical protein